MKVIDGKGKPLGRIASLAAEYLLKGEEVHIVNAEEIVISGNREDIFRKWKTRVDLTNKGNPYKAPKYPRTVWGIVRRAVRGMLPWGRKRGRRAFRRLRVWYGVPERFRGKVESPEFQTPKKYITVKELAELLGGR